MTAYWLVLASSAELLTVVEQLARELPLAVEADRADYEEELLWVASRGRAGRDHGLVKERR